LAGLAHGVARQAGAGGSVCASIRGGGLRSGCSFPLLRSLFLLQMRSDAVQVIGQDSESDVALVSAFAFVRTAIKSVVF
jgi:hypothetical protein